MGYYVRIEETASNFKIKKENFERGYEIVCDLNRHDYLKHGGNFGGDLNDGSTASPATQTAQPARTQDRSIERFGGVRER